MKTTSRLVCALLAIGAPACSCPPAEPEQDGFPAARGVADAGPVDNGYAELLARLPAVGAFDLDETQAARFARLSLDCVDREYPNKPGHVVDGDETVKPPRELHPAFYGCFDWHSAVHGHWALVRIAKQFNGFRLEKEIRAVLDRRLTPQTIAAEIAYFEGTNAELFERPYGWGWLLRLHAELATWNDPDAQRWAATVRPLAELLSGMAGRYFAALSVPVRAGTHHSTAYAMIHMHDYARAVGDTELAAVIERRGVDFFAPDEGCPAAYEPSGEDFVSPCLVEADLMRRLLPPDRFAGWLDRFLPPLDAPGFAALREPPEVKDREDPRIGHLIGLSLQRAAAYRGIGRALPADDPRREVFDRLSAIHRDHGLGQMFDSGYGGAHWLASFAIYLLTDAGLGTDDGPTRSR